jgi:hypothetical protein
MPAGMIAMFVSMVMMPAIYAMIYRKGSGTVEGARFGALIGVLRRVRVCGVNLNIGLALTMQQAIAYFVEWTVAGMVIGFIYRPAAA